MDNSQLIVILILLGLPILLIYLWRRKGVKERRRYADSALLEAASIPSFRRSIEHLNRELSRARRTQSHLSIIVIEYQPTAPGSDSRSRGDSPESSGTTRRSKDRNITDFLLCGKVIRDALREIDIISYAATNNQFIIALPESTRPKAEVTLRRIKAIIGKNADQWLAEVAEFPDDGLILDDLVAHAANLIRNRDEDTITDW